MEGQVGKRFALVFGNSTYEQAADLDGAEYDARRMKEELENRGFVVEMCRNCTAQCMHRKLQQFCQSLKQRNAAHKQKPSRDNVNYSESDSASMDASWCAEDSLGHEQHPDEVCATQCGVHYTAQVASSSCAAATPRATRRRSTFVCTPGI
jgi:hypothetical protein